MSKIPVKNEKGEAVGEYDLPDSLLVLDKGSQAVHEAVVAYRANQRAGTASTLGKGEVAGSGAKPWKQKGTGRARAGYQQSPVWRGGSVAFGPKPRSFAKRMTRKTSQLAFRRALSEKVANGEVVIFEGLSPAAPKTREVAAFLDSLEARKGALIVLGEPQSIIRLSARNIPGVAVTTAQHLNVYDLLKYPALLVSKSGMEELEKRLSGSGRQG